MATDKIILPEVKIISANKNEATFSLEPLSPGYGLTIGNALRRVLLSSLEGVAVYAVKIEGVTHEFTALPGVKEDLVLLLLNIKALNVALEGDDQVILKLEAKGQGTVKAGDIKTPSGCKITNPELEIAHLDRGAKLSMELYADKGMGYVPVERRDEKEFPLEIILIDSAYTPVKKVNFKVEDMRVGQATNYNRLVLEIVTNDSITPSAALKKASGILAVQFDTMHSGIESEKPKAAIKPKKAKKAVKVTAKTKKGKK